MLKPFSLTIAEYFSSDTFEKRTIIKNKIKFKEPKQSIVIIGFIKNFTEFKQKVKKTYKSYTLIPALEPRQTFEKTDVRLKQKTIPVCPSETIQTLPETSPMLVIK